MTSVFSKLRGHKLWKGAGILFAGHLGSAVFNLVSLSIAARALGPESLGVLVLITAYVQVVDQIVNSQSWHALIKYGADCLADDDRGDLKNLVKFGMAVDIATALSGAAIAALGIRVCGSIIGWSPEMVGLATGYSILIAFNISGAPIALLRLFEKFSWLAVQTLFGSAVRLVGVIIGIVYGFDLAGFLTVWFISQLLGYLMLVGLGYAVARREGVADFIGGTLTAVSRRHTGIWGFVVTTNLQTSIRLGTTEFDTMIVGGVLGPTGAGFYGVIKRFARVLGLVSTPLAQVVYPALAKAWSQNDFQEYRRLIVQATLIVSVLSAMLVLSFAFVGEWIILQSVGAQFLDAHVPLVTYFVGVALATGSFAVYPALLAAGKPRVTFAILCVSTGLYLPILLVLTRAEGLLGSAFAYVIFYLIWVPLSALMLFRTYKSKKGG